MNCAQRPQSDLVPKDFRWEPATGRWHLGLVNMQGDVAETVHNLCSGRLRQHVLPHTTNMGPDIEQILRSADGVIRRADHPRLVKRLDRLRRGGELDSPLPGVLCVPGLTARLPRQSRRVGCGRGPMP